MYFIKQSQCAYSWIIFYHNNIIPWLKVGLLHMYLHLFSYQLEVRMYFMHQSQCEFLWIIFYYNNIIPWPKVQ